MNYNHSIDFDINSNKHISMGRFTAPLHDFEKKKKSVMLCSRVPKKRGRYHVAPMSFKEN
jgi:ubiquinone/menaquinone biosynthesis C-methylase UbiE